MKLPTIVLMLLIASGCTTSKPIELAPEQLHKRISTEDIIRVGDDVKIVTSDGISHKFKVTAITENRILGKDIDIPIMDIVALETREFSGGKTSLLVGGTVLWMFIILLSIPAIVVL